MLGIEQIIADNLLGIFGGNIYLLGLFVLVIFALVFMYTGLPMIATLPLYVGVIVLIGIPELTILFAFIAGGILGLFILSMLKR